MDKQQLLKRLEKAWAAIEESYDGLSDSQLTEPCVIGNWSVKDILAHVTTWEEERLHPKRARRALHTGDALPTSPTARYLQPLPDARQGDTGMAGAVSRIREVQEVSLSQFHLESLNLA